MISIGITNGKGRGIFAQKQFAKGEIIERAPVIVIPGVQEDLADKTVLYNYCYEWGGDIALALGYGSLYNHSYQPNAIYTKNLQEMVVEFIALRDIETQEEITINYNCCPDDNSPLWFKVLS